MQRNGGYGSTIPGVEQILGRCYALNLLCVICRAYQCAARRCRAQAPSLRKAPLPSRVYSWSSKRPCGPLAFRRATGGSRVLRKGWGVKRGRETLVSLPLLSPPGDPGNPPAARRRQCHAMSWRTSPCPEGPVSPPPAAPLYRRKGIPSADGKKYKGAARSLNL